MQKFLLNTCFAYNDSILGAEACSMATNKPQPPYYSITNQFSG